MDYEFRDPLPLARVVRIVMVVWLVTAIAYAAGAVHSLATIGAFQSGSASQEDLELVDTVGLAVAIPMILINIATIILVARWIYRVNKNAHAMSSGMMMSPGWNVGFFFIPILNLWKPFEGIRQTWRASMAPADPESVLLPAWLTLWWIAWVITNILGNISGRLSFRAESLDDYVAVAWIDLACLPFDLVAGATLMLLVARLSRVQHDAHDVEAHEAVFA